MSKLVLTRPMSPETMFEAFTMFADELQRRFSFGSGTITWPGGTPKSSVLTVTHELDSTPVSVTATMQVDTAETKVIGCSVRNVGATTFEVFAEYVDGTNGTLGQSRTVFWKAVR